MYIPPAFRLDDLPAIHGAMREARLATLVTMTEEGLIGTPLPMLVDPNDGPYGTLHAHLARANAQWKLAPTTEAMAIFTGANAYITPSWYVTKQETGKVVPTWNYVAIHAYGPVEFFDDGDRLLDVVTRLTDLYESPRSAPWAVADAPMDFVKSQLKGIVGLRMPLTRIDAKRKMSQNRNAADREGVVQGLAQSARADEQDVAGLVPRA